MIYLYLKTHNKTGYKYLGKTIDKDPHKYSGSGKLWLRHLEKHGYDYETTILKTCETKEELKIWGLYYSNLWNIVESKEFANLIEEAGDGGITRKNFNHSKETLLKLSKPKKDTSKMKLAQKRLASINSEKQKNWHKNPENLKKKLKSMRTGCLSKEARKKHAEKIKLLKWCNDGVKNYRLQEIPEGYNLGRI